MTRSPWNSGLIAWPQAEMARSCLSRLENRPRGLVGGGFNGKLLGGMRYPALKWRRYPAGVGFFLNCNDATTLSAAFTAVTSVWTILVGFVLTFVLPRRRLRLSASLRTAGGRVECDLFIPSPFLWPASENLALNSLISLFSALEDFHQLGIRILVLAAPRPFFPAPGSA